MSSQLTTTSYSVLGLLAIRPWTTYELAKQMDVAMAKFWPRARSKVYEEPKKLVAHNLATSTAGSVGKRPRTTYAITAKGRRALATWLKTPSAPPSLEMEQLVKVFLGNHGSKESLLATIRSSRGWLREHAAQGIEIGERYLSGETEFAYRAAQNLLVGRFLYEFDELVDRWSTWAEETVEAWPEDLGSAEPDLEMLARSTAKSRARLRRLSKLEQ